MICYINKLYTYNNDDAGAELVIEDTEHGDITYLTDTVENIVKSYNEYIGDGYFMDFKVMGSRSIFPLGDVTTLNLPNKELLPIGNKKIKRVMSIYDLLNILISSDGVYVDKIEDVNDGYVGFLSSFKNMRVSNSTMSINISIQNENGEWRTRQIIKTEEGKFRQQKFNFAIPKSSKSALSSYSDMHVKDIIMNNIEYAVYTYECSLPICNSLSDFTIPTPLICHYSYLSYAYKNIISVMKDFLIAHSMYATSTTSSGVQYNKKTATDYTGVYFKIDEKDLDKKSRETLISIFEKLISQYSREKIASANISNVMQNFNLPPISSFVFKTLFNNIEFDKEQNQITMESYDNVSTFMSEINKQYLENELFLFNTRISCMYNPRLIGNMGNNNRKYIRGSIYDARVCITRREDNLC